MKVPYWVQENISLKNYNTLRINGKTKYFVKISSKDKLIKTLQWAKENSLPIFILGNGSNILLPDKKYQGIIIQIKNQKGAYGESQTTTKNKKKSIILGAGIYLPEFLQKCIKNKWTGFEWMSGIPGTIGGAVFCNAGAFGYHFGDFVKRVRTISLETGKEKIYSQKQSKFGYRESIFKKNREIIWEVEVWVKKGDRAEIMEKSKNYLKYKIDSGIFKYPSAGSIFKNIFAKKVSIEYRKQAVVKKGKISAGWFIEKCNLKGKRYGGAMISPFHANVIINIKNAKAKDVLYLINLCKEKIYKKFKIKLEEEIIIIHY